jgi:hypothetical protein
MPQGAIALPVVYVKVRPEAALWMHFPETDIAQAKLYGIFMLLY